MIETRRLRLRRWRMTDAAAYRALCSEPAVARFLGTPPTLARARATLAAQNATLDTTGSCFWAVEHRGTATLVGWCGIKPGPDHTPIAGLPEIGWTVASAWQRRGLAREAAAATLAWVWAQGRHPAVYAIVVPANMPSRRLMRALGLKRLTDSAFDHPALAPGDPLRRHLIYRIERPVQGVGSVAETAAIAAASRSASAAARAWSAPSAG